MNNVPCKDCEALVIILARALTKAQLHLDFCGYGDAYERECAYDDKLPELVDIAVDSIPNEIMEKIT